jgi:hypothetical protein
MLDEREQQPRRHVDRVPRSRRRRKSLTRQDILDIFTCSCSGLDTQPSVGCMAVVPGAHPISGNARRRPSQIPSGRAAAMGDAGAGRAQWEPGRRALRRAMETGERITVLLGSANIDEHGFPEPENVDFGPANRHLAFGGGVRRCLGSHLARSSCARSSSSPRRIPITDQTGRGRSTPWASGRSVPAARVHAAVVKVRRHRAVRRARSLLRRGRRVRADDRATA